MDGRAGGSGKKEIPSHQIKARSRARIFRDPRRNESRYRAEKRHRGEAEHSFAGTPSRIDPGRFTAGIDLIDD